MNADVEARDHLPPPLHEDERLAAVDRRIELGAVAQPARVVERILLPGLGRGAVAGFDFDHPEGRHVLRTSSHLRHLREQDRGREY